jgi:hypothetical protein
MKYGYFVLVDSQDEREGAHKRIGKLIARALYMEVGDKATVTTLSRGVTISGPGTMHVCNYNPEAHGG